MFLRALTLAAFITSAVTPMKAAEQRPRSSQRHVITRSNNEFWELSSESAEATHFGARTHHAQSRLQIWLGRSGEWWDGLFRVCLLRAQSKRRRPLRT